MYGTAGASAPGNAATADWEAAFVAEYGALPVLAYVKETYDATVALALAAQAAGSVDGAAIRDRLREIAGPPGVTVLGTPSGVADGLALLAEGRKIDFERGCKHAGLGREWRSAPRPHRDVALHVRRAYRRAGHGVIREIATVHACYDLRMKAGRGVR